MCQNQPFCFRPEPELSLAGFGPELLISHARKQPKDLSKFYDFCIGYTAQY